MNLASMLRVFKTGVKKHATIHQIDFAWQERYHDHIIRNVQAFDSIPQYIRNNVRNRKDDDLF